MMGDIKLVKQLKAMGDENRLRILHMLSGGELCACRLLEDLSIGQPTLSHHMKILCDSGLVNARKEGKWMHYSISKEAMQDMADYFGNFFDGANQEEI